MGATYIALPEFLGRITWFTVSIVWLYGQPTQLLWTRHFTCRFQTLYSQFLATSSCHVSLLGEGLLQTFNFSCIICLCISYIRPTVMCHYLCCSLPFSFVDPIVWHTSSANNAIHTTVLLICLKDSWSFPVLLSAQQPLNTKRPSNP